MTSTHHLTERQRLMIQAALDAAADALNSGEWSDLPGFPVNPGHTVAPLLVHLAGLIGSAKDVAVHTGYGEDA